MHKETGIRVCNIVKKFGTTSVLRHCSLTIEKGQSFVLIGQSGGGKSVLLKCMIGLLDWNGGSVQIGPHLLSRESNTEQEKRFSHSGVVFQSYALFDSLTIWENVAFGISGSSSQRKEQAIALLARVHLGANIADLYPEELSGGMKRRVSIARAIALKPSYLFFDEPTEGLDPVLSSSISLLIRDVIKELNATTFTISHSMKNAAIIGDQIGLLDQGAIVWQGQPSVLQTDPFPLLQAFMQGEFIKKE